MSFHVRLTPPNQLEAQLADAAALGLAPAGIAAALAEAGHWQDLRHWSESLTNPADRIEVFITVAQVLGATG